MLAKSWLVRLPMGTPFFDVGFTLSLSLSLSLSRKFNRVTTHNAFEQPHRVRVFYFSTQQVKQYGVVDAIKEFSHVTLERIARLRTVTTLSAQHICENSHTFVVAFADATGKGCDDKSRLEDRVKDAKDCVMQHSVAHGGLVYAAHLRITNPKPLIRPMPIRFLTKIVVKSKNILLKVSLKVSHIGPVPFVAFENAPCGE